MDDDAARRLHRHVYPRPPADVLDEALLRGFHKPEEQDWIRGDDLHAETPRPFRCGFHRPDVEGPGPVEVVDLAGVDGKTYRVGQCPRCGRMFLGRTAGCRRPIKRGMVKPNETARYECGECRMAFDLSLDPARVAEIAAELGQENIGDVRPICCPFCGDGDIRAAHDSPTQIPATATEK